MRHREHFKRILCCFSALILLMCCSVPALAASDTVSADSGYLMQSGSEDMYRMYNPNSGEHFYTHSQEERNSLIFAGWRYEGVGWTAPVSSDTPVYRLYNPNAGDHHYTKSTKERDNLKTAGWRDEGIGWYSAPESGYPVYREYNPNAKAGAHNFTTSSKEHEMLGNAGWHLEGIAWYALGTEHGVTRWTVTEYGGNEDGRGHMMFYTVTDGTHLIIIDGGWASNAENVKKVIDGYGGHVDAWIITHSHPDHCGAFISLMQSRAVSVGRIYTNRVDREYYEAHADAYIDTYYALQSIFDENSGITSYLLAGDEFDECGLHFKVFSSWNDETYNITSDIPNASSLMFKMTGEANSFLFCGDTIARMTDFIVSNYGNELGADYLQAAHHGNWSFGTDFYDTYVKPRVVFIDAYNPVFIYNPDSESPFEGQLLMNHFENEGIKCYMLEDSPHRVYFY